MALAKRTASYNSAINVTPMVDVMLVLLIIFMVITPLTPKGLDALVPQPPKDKQQQEPNDRTVVVQILSQKGNKPALKINQDDATWEGLQGKLEDIYKTRAERCCSSRVTTTSRSPMWRR